MRDSGRASRFHHEEIEMEVECLLRPKGIERERKSIRSRECKRLSVKMR